MSSGDFFDKLLTECNVIGTPGSGFSPSGEGLFRLSAFGNRDNVEEAVERIKINLRDYPHNAILPKSYCATAVKNAI